MHTSSTLPILINQLVGQFRPKGLNPIFPGLLGFIFLFGIFRHIIPVQGVGVVIADNGGSSIHIGNGQLDPAIVVEPVVFTPDLQPLRAGGSLEDCHIRRGGFLLDIQPGVNPADQFPSLPLGQLHIHLDFLLKFNFTFGTDHMNLFGGPDNGSATGGKHTFWKMIRRFCWNPSGQVAGALQG